MFSPTVGAECLRFIPRVDEITSVDVMVEMKEIFNFQDYLPSIIPAINRKDVALVREILSDKRFDPSMYENAIFNTASYSGNVEIIQMLMMDERVVRKIPEHSTRVAIALLDSTAIEMILQCPSLPVPSDHTVIFFINRMIIKVNMDVIRLASTSPSFKDGMREILGMDVSQATDVEIYNVCRDHIEIKYLSDFDGRQHITNIIMGKMVEIAQAYVDRYPDPRFNIRWSMFSNDGKGYINYIGFDMARKELNNVIYTARCLGFTKAATILMQIGDLAIIAGVNT